MLERIGEEKRAQERITSLKQKVKNAEDQFTNAYQVLRETERTVTP